MSIRDRVEQVAYQADCIWTSDRDIERLVELVKDLAQIVLELEAELKLPRS